VLYRVFDSVLTSDWPLPELPPAEGAARAAIAIERGAAPFDDRDVVWFREWRVPDEEPWLTAARLRAGGYIVRVPDLADFLIDDAGTRVRVVGRADTPDDTLRHLFLDHILPLVMTNRGELVLHASGVLLAQGAVLFIARSGSGKSTIAAALGAAGAGIVADDAIALRESGEGLLAIGAYSGLRLWTSGQSDKRRISPADSSMPFVDTPVRVAGIYVLDPSGSGSIRIDPLPAREAVMALVANSYILDCGDRERLERQLDHAVGCGRAVPVRRLAFPHDPERLDELCQSVISDCRFLA
jgi:hypothetical protein